MTHDTISDMHDRLRELTQLIEDACQLRVDMRRAGLVNTHDLENCFIEARWDRDQLAAELRELERSEKSVGAV